MDNFLEIKTDTAVLVGRSGDADYLSKIEVWINIAQKFLERTFDYWVELQDVFNFSTVASQENYVLPNRFSKPFRLYDLTNNKRLFSDVEEVYIDGNIANISNAIETKAPAKYRIYGSKGVNAPISTSGDTVKVKSSSSSDTGGIVVRVEGYINSDRTLIAYENITISTGTPTTFVSGSVTFYEITHWSKSTDTVGFVTLADSSDDTLDVLGSTERVSTHLVLKLGLIPSKVNSMRLLLKKKVFKLVNDYDYPFADVGDYLKFKSAAMALSQDREPQKAEFMFNQASEALEEILRDQNSKLGPDFQKKMVSVWANAHRS